MNRDEKAAVVEEIAGQIEAAEAIFAIDYRGLTVPQAAELRTKLRDADATFRIVKNSLTERAADRAGAESLKQFLIGPTALALVRGDAALAAKTLNDTSRALRILEFKGGLLNGTPLTAQDVTSIARLPSRDVLNAQLVGTIAAPLVGLVRGLNGLLAGIAIQLQQVLEQGLIGSAESAESAGADSVGSSVEVAESAGADSVGSSVEVADGGAGTGAELPGGAESAPEAEAAAESAPEAPAAPEAAAEPEPATTTTEETDQDSASEDASDA